jgi:ABC-type multidrug transport system permease subunit
MGADFMRIVLQGLMIMIVGMAVGTTVETGVPGALALVGIASIWGLAYSAIGFAMALKTGNSQIVGSMWAFQIPFLFLTTGFAPREGLSGWLETAARYNPMTYLLDGLRAFSLGDGGVVQVLIAIAIALAFGALTVTIAYRALLGRLR